MLAFCQKNKNREDARVSNLLDHEIQNVRSTFTATDASASRPAWLLRGKAEICSRASTTDGHLPGRTEIYSRPTLHSASNKDGLKQLVANHAPNAMHKHPTSIEQNKTWDGGNQGDANYPASCRGGSHLKWHLVLARGTFLFCAVLGRILHDALHVNQ